MHTQSTILRTILKVYVSLVQGRWNAVLNDKVKQHCKIHIAQSAGEIWITRLCHFQPFALELVAVDYPWLHPDICWFL